MEALINRYENKRALVDIHITEILSVPKIQSENPALLRFLIDTVRNRESQRLFQLNLKTTEVPSLQDFFSFLETRCIQLESIRKTDHGTKNIPEKIVSTLGSDKVLQPSSEELSFVSLPFKENIQENVNLGDSRSIASKRLDQLWRRIDRDPKLNNLYTNFIEEYFSLDHIEEITNIDDITSEEGFFLPHHGVLRAGSRYHIPQDLNELESLKTEFTQLFKSAGISLHKWCFSHSTNDFTDLHFDQSSEENITKTLSVLWNSSSDTFCFQVSPSSNHNFTKRDVPSQITRIFDPLGLLGPVISKSKFFMQQLWLLKLEWHEKLPIATEWASFVQSLPVLEMLKIPRFVLSENLESIIHYGFSDASEKGFGTDTYVSVIKNNGDRHSQLLCSKSRVAPLKTLTIPRLESYQHAFYFPRL
ncbi:integrase catalytic domain-containing protein [Trichonephila inaurata madagascariensis]|uniref:Integrase catalytic domain-containing protein n=1 Tax=Trichonephila inaurata madagascariensis TaxID=2747483 RepID=A0A8X6YT93_9ARAC|nr:integrase catalytic domain-containing protein [Trichonephila inaurata madagascariensis]